MLGLKSESGLGLGLELESIQYIKLLIQYTVNWVAKADDLTLRCALYQK